MSTTITTEKISKAFVNIPYYFELSVDGGTAPYTWVVTNDTNIPDGLSVSSAGVISGTPINTGFTETPMPFRTKEVFLEITATDSDLNQTSGRATIKVEVGRAADKASLDEIVGLVKDVDNSVPVSVFLPIVLGITDVALRADALNYIDALAMGSSGVPNYILVSS